jgi:hypothetical protein
LILYGEKERKLLTQTILGVCSKTRAKQVILAFSVLIAISSLLMPVYAGNVHFLVKQSPGVTATGTVEFYKGATKVGETTVQCVGEEKTYDVAVTDIPDKIKWNINITWGDGSPIENWAGEGAWPGEYKATKGTKSVILSSHVGGLVFSVDKLTLLKPYIGIVSITVIAAAAATIYFKRVKHQKE